MARAKKAGEDLKTIEESMRRLKEKEKGKGKARAVDKVKREPRDCMCLCPQTRSPFFFLTFILLLMSVCRSASLNFPICLLYELVSDTVRWLCSIHNFSGFTCT